MPNHILINTSHTRKKEGRKLETFKRKVILSDADKHWKEMYFQKELICIFNIRQELSGSKRFLTNKNSPTGHTFSFCWHPIITGAHKDLVMYKRLPPDSNHTTAVRACHAGAPPGGQLLRLYAYKATRCTAYKWCFIASRPQVTSSFKILRVMCVSSVYVGGWGLAVTLCCLVDEYLQCRGTCYLHVEDTSWRHKVP
jgi:hypothetical protein